MHLQYITPATHDQLLRAPSGAYGLAVAIAAAFSVTVPTAPVDDIDAYIKGATEQAICRVVGIFNEVRPLNCEDAIQVATQAYKARYEVAHGLILEKIESMTSASPLDVFGIGFCMTPAVTQKISENANDIMVVLGACIKAARQISASSAPEAV